jgi:hypothetical protein|tara:strand:+ start:1675 stop:1869 length:195 start_codon:yes stop_codon:yes gene_type:complete
MSADMYSVGAKILTFVGRNEGVVDFFPFLSAPASSREKENPVPSRFESEWLMNIWLFSHRDRAL